jgi:hypothetical protein
MELAIPMIVVGGMYVLSNQEKDNKTTTSNSKENYENMRLKKNRANLLKAKNEMNNFPVNGHSSLKNNVNYYSNPNSSVDKFFHSDVYHQQANNDPKNYRSLTGNVVKAGDLKHNNMTPYFGSKVKQNMDFLNNENRLDNMVGNGSQHIKKQEQAPLFKPQENMQWGHGTPNTSDFIQSRINPSMNMANVKPFQEVRVGPGLSEKGGVLGSGGFNAGMQMRDKWMPKSVDELRVANNPKESYEGVILGGKRDVQNRGVMGKMEKHRPDTYYKNSPDRYMVTTGIQKAQTARSNQVLKYENRGDTTKEHYGVSGDNTATYVNGQYNAPKRATLEAPIKHISNPKTLNDNPNGRQVMIQGYKNSKTTNNRSIDQQRDYGMGPIKALQQAVIAPLLDIMRPSRKENFVGNLRKSGNARVVDGGAGYVYNPAEKAKTTVRETTENSKGHRFVNSQKEAGGYGYIVNKQQSVNQQRDTTLTEYSGAGYLDGGNGYSVTDHYAPVQQRDTTNKNYIGNAGNTVGTSNATTYDAAYNANLINKEPLSRGRTPMGSNIKMFNNQHNMKIDKVDKDRNNNRMYAPSNTIRQTPALENYGQYTVRSEYGQNIHTLRNNPDTLNAFKNNPYTKPLNSVA